MRRHLEKWLDAFRDGALSETQMRRAERRLAADPESAGRVAETEQLGRAVRSAWSDGPRSPSPEYLIAALRPELTRIDAELGVRQRLAAFLERLVADARAALPSPAVAAGACAALLLLFTVPTLMDPPHALPHTQLSNFRVPETTPIYDLAQGERPLMIFEGPDGSTVIWILDPLEQLSFSWLADGWA